MALLSFQLVAGEGDHRVQVLVGGRPLPETAGGTVASWWTGPTVSEIGSSSRHYLDRPAFDFAATTTGDPEDAPGVEDLVVEFAPLGGTVLAGTGVATCSCGGFGCSSVFVDVVLLPWAVRWERFYDGTGTTLERLGPFEFRRGAYERALADLDRQIAERPVPYGEPRRERW